MMIDFFFFEVLCFSDYIVVVVFVKRIVEFVDCCMNIS